MSQTRLFDFGETLTSEVYSFMTRELLVPGVYRGFDAQQVPNGGSGFIADEIKVTPGLLLLSNGIIVSEDQTQSFKFALSATPQRYLLVVRHKFVPIVGGAPAEFSVIKVETLAGFVAGYAFFVLATIDTINSTGVNQGTIANSLKIKEAFTNVLENSAIGNITESFAVPWSGGGGSSNNCIESLCECLKNGSGSDRIEGEVVKISGNRTFDLSQANAEENVHGTIGVVRSDLIPNNSEGSVTTHGKQSVRFEDGLTLNPGDTAFVSANFPGLLTNIPPAIIFPLGIIKDASTYDGTLGSEAVVDLQMNFLTSGSSSSSYKFSGILDGVVLGARTRYLADAGAEPINGIEILTAQDYTVCSDIEFRCLKVNVKFNSLTTNTVATLLKNGAATGLTVTIPGGATGIFAISGSESYSDGDKFDIRLTNTNGGSNVIAVSVITEYVGEGSGSGGGGGGGSEIITLQAYQTEEVSNTDPTADSIVAWWNVNFDRLTSSTITADLSFFGRLSALANISQGKLKLMVGSTAINLMDGAVVVSVDVTGVVNAGYGDDATFPKPIGRKIVQLLSRGGNSTLGSRTLFAFGVVALLSG